MSFEEKIKAHRKTTTEIVKLGTGQDFYVKLPVAYTDWVPASFVFDCFAEDQKERKQKLQAISELLDKLQDKAVFDWHQDSSKFISVSNFAELRKKFEELLKEVEAK